MHHQPGIAVTVRFALPSEKLRPYVTTYYLTQVKSPSPRAEIEDYLHPEWPNLRFMRAGWASSAIGDAPLATVPALAITGATSKAARFRIGSGRSWGIGLMPLGWASLFDIEAGDYADRIADGSLDPAFAKLRPLARYLCKPETALSFAQEVALIEEHLEPLFANEPPNADAIAAINSALVDPDVATVAELAERVGMIPRSLERLTRRAFGFPPKLLLRRQRFLRSLAQFMLDPSLKWLSTLDSHYHDQAHFVRDFKQFMGMTPREYSKMEKPLLVAAARARMAIAGEAVQGLHDPKASE